MQCSFEKHEDRWVCSACGRDWLGDFPPAIECSGVQKVEVQVQPMMERVQERKAAAQKRSGCGCGKKK